MMNQLQAAALMQQEIPELADAASGVDENIYRSMHRLLAYTTGKIREHNYKAAARCFRLAEAMYETGNHVVRNLIENMFVYAFSSFFHIAEKDRERLIGVIPQRLYVLYLDQACHKGY